jgi:hypothetical protein
MDRKSGAFDPRPFGCGKEGETFACAPLHLHDMGDDVNGARMSRVKAECPPGDLFSTAILAVLLKGERVHREDTRVAGHRGPPFGEQLGDTIPHHAPPAKAEVQRMRDHECRNVARPVDDNGAVTFGRKGWIALKPGARGGRVTTRAVVHVVARRLDGGQALGKPGICGAIVSTHDDGGAQTMAEYASGMLSNHSLDDSGGIAAMREQQLECEFACIELCWDY